MRASFAAIIACVLGLMLAAPTQAPAQAPDRAQEWPQPQVTIVVPFGAGGSADLLARILATQMQAKYGTPFVVENRAGAGGSTGTGYVAKAASDGRTLLLGTVSSIAVNAALYSKLSFDVDRDLQPVSQLVSFPNLLVVDPKLPVKTIPELIAYLKANEGKINYGSSGLGTSSHLSVVMLERAIGTKMTHVPFRSTGEVVNSMLGGNIHLAIDSMTTIWPQAEAGQVRALGVSTPRRSATAPNVPAIGETVAGFEAVAWQGLFARRDDGLTGNPAARRRLFAGLKSAALYCTEGHPFDTVGAPVDHRIGVNLLTNWYRYALGDAGSGTHIDLTETVDAPRGFWGVGSIHHLAWRVDDEAHQLAVRERVAAAARRPTPVIDRFWFKSVYFKEPGGVLFELATDGPGFSVDENPEHLGETLVLPPWLEAQRTEIEAGLPRLTPAAPAEAAR
jgi:tripartite-type tricarboxylate transporter receptor subunit TctC